MIRKGVGYKKFILHSNLSAWAYKTNMSPTNCWQTIFLLAQSHTHWTMFTLGEEVILLLHILCRVRNLNIAFVSSTNPTNSYGVIERSTFTCIYKFVLLWFVPCRTSIHNSICAWLFSVDAVCSRIFTSGNSSDFSVVSLGRRTSDGHVKSGLSTIVEWWNKSKILKAQMSMKL